MAGFIIIVLYAFWLLFLFTLLSRLAQLGTIIYPVSDAIRRSRLLRV
jgi:hypothetical protein